MTELSELKKILTERFQQKIESISLIHNELTIEVLPENLKIVALALRDEEPFRFEELMDLCGVDYLHYGVSEWTTDAATSTGFERGTKPVASLISNSNWHKPRFAVVYHLLSISHNHRLRLKVFVNNEQPIVDSVVDIYASANWYEREAFDLYGILFANHPDLRRLLTDYGFIGHPFRKDFPVSGNLEVRYDKSQERVLYEKVDIQPRILVPKTIRQDPRYENEQNQKDAE